MNELKFPASMAFPAYFMIIFVVLVGANTLSTAISIPIVPKLANPSKIPPNVDSECLRSVVVQLTMIAYHREHTWRSLSTGPLNK